MLSDHKNLKYFATTKQLTHRQVHWSEYLSGFNYLICYQAGWLGTKPDTLTHHKDVYPRGENAYALANPHNFQSMFKAGQLLRAIVLDSASLISIRHGLQADPIAQSHLTFLRVGPDSTTTTTATALPDPWSLSQDGDFLHYKGLLYVPDNQDVQLDILRSHHDHHLAGHPGITKTIKSIHHQFYWPLMVTFITDYIHSCSVCSHSKSLHHKPLALIIFSRSMNDLGTRS